jgi:hypothetical protein
VCQAMPQWHSFIGDGKCQWHINLMAT